MRILLTGSTGFLGSHILKELLNNNHQITILKRSTSDISRISEIIKNVITYDIDKVNIEHVFENNPKFDSVIHMATSYGRKNESLSEIIDTNISFPIRLLDLCVKNNTDTFYNTDTVLENGTNYYASTKNILRKLLNLYSDSKKIKICNVRLEHIYGTNDDETKFVMYLINSMKNNNVSLDLTLGEQIRDFVYISDVVKAYIILLKNQSSFSFFEEFNLGSGKLYTIKELALLVHKLTLSTTELRFGALPYRKGELMCSKSDITKLKDLGWEPTTELVDGLTEIISIILKS